MRKARGDFNLQSNDRIGGDEDGSDFHNTPGNHYGYGTSNVRHNAAGLAGGSGSEYGYGPLRHQDFALDPALGGDGQYGANCSRPHNSPGYEAQYATGSHRHYAGPTYSGYGDIKRYACLAGEYPSYGAGQDQGPSHGIMAPPPVPSLGQPFRSQRSPRPTVSAARYTDIRKQKGLDVQSAPAHPSHLFNSTAAPPPATTETDRAESPTTSTIPVLCLSLLDGADLLPRPIVSMPPLGAFSPPKARRNGKQARKVLEKHSNSGHLANGGDNAANGGVERIESSTKPKQGQGNAKRKNSKRGKKNDNQKKDSVVEEDKRMAEG